MTSSERHELNNVLAALLAEAQLLQLDPLPPEQTEGVNRVVEHARRLKDLLRAQSMRNEPAGV
jgi:hypothetical protein